MADIVERLRQDFTSDPIPIHAEAAAEIERLRAALEEIVRESNGVSKGAVAQKIAIGALAYVSRQKV